MEGRRYDRWHSTAKPALVAPLATVSGTIQPVVTQVGDYVWAHQDSWSRAQVFEVDPESGEPQGDVVVDFQRGTQVRAWSPSGSTLFVADISMNWHLRDFELLRRYDVAAVSEQASEDIYQVPRLTNTTWYSWGFSQAVWVGWPGIGEGHRYTINLTEVEGGDSTVVMFSDSRIRAARLSDDTDSIAFLEGRLAGQGTIGFVDVASGSVRRLYDGAKLEIPNWSPDGMELAVAERPCVKILNVESGEAETLACYPEPPEADAGVRTSSPHWSPDGSRLFGGALNPVLRRHEIWVLDRSTGTHRVIWTGEENYKTETAHARWSPDGRYIAFILIDNPSVEIWKLRHPRLTSGPPSVSD
jgi:WD40 repeat protein